MDTLHCNSKISSTWCSRKMHHIDDIKPLNGDSLLWHIVPALTLPAREVQNNNKRSLCRFVPLTSSHNSKTFAPISMLSRDKWHRCTATPAPTRVCKQDAPTTSCTWQYLFPFFRKRNSRKEVWVLSTATVPYLQHDAAGRCTTLTISNRCNVKNPLLLFLLNSFLPLLIYASTYNISIFPYNMWFSKNYICSDFEKCHRDFICISVHS